MNNQFRYIQAFSRNLHNQLPRNQYQTATMNNIETFDRIHRHENGKFLNWEFDRGLRSVYNKDLHVATGTISFDNGQLAMSDGCVLEYPVNALFPKKDFMLLTKWTQGSASQGSVAIEFENGFSLVFGYNATATEYIATWSAFFEDGSSQVLNSVEGYAGHAAYLGHDVENELALVFDNTTYEEVSLFLNQTKIGNWALNDPTKGLTIDVTRKLKITHNSTALGFKMNNLVFYDMIPDGEGGLDYIVQSIVLLYKDISLAYYDGQQYGPGNTTWDNLSPITNQDMNLAAVTLPPIYENNGFTFSKLNGANGVLQQVIQTPDTQTSNSHWKHSISIWFKITDQNTLFKQPIFDLGKISGATHSSRHSALEVRYSSDPRWYIVWVHSGNDFNLSSYVGVADLIPNTWYNIVYTTDENRKSRIYFNGGQLVYYQTLNTNVLMQSDSPLTLGGSTYLNEFFDGSIGHVSVYDNYNLSYEEIVNLYNSRATLYNRSLVTTAFSYDKLAFIFSPENPSRIKSYHSTDQITIDNTTFNSSNLTANTTINGKVAFSGRAHTSSFTYTQHAYTTVFVCQITQLNNVSTFDCYFQYDAGTNTTAAKDYGFIIEHNGLKAYQPEIYDVYTIIGAQVENTYSDPYWNYLSYVNVPLIFYADYEGSTYTFKVYDIVTGQLIHTGSRSGVSFSTGSTGSSHAHIGDNGQTASGARYGDVFFYNKKLNTNEETQIISYLLSKWQ